MEGIQVTLVFKVTELAYRYEGKPTKSQVTSSMGKSFSLFETEFNYLEAKSGCTNYESWKLF